LRALPILLVLRNGERDCPVVSLLAGEIVKNEPGQEPILDRLLDLR
jgi:Cupin